MSAAPTPRPRVAVVGGGISGLAAAWHLACSGQNLDVVVLDGSDRLGGKLRGAEVAGIRVDVGAESMLARRPEGVDLTLQAGLADRVVHPEPVGAGIWSRGRMHPMPTGTLMGVPADPAAALGVLDEAEVARAGKDRPEQPLTEDISVGELVERHLGPAVVDRLVEPLLGGVYAGRARALSVRATVPALWEAAQAGTPLTLAAQRATSAGVRSAVGADRGRQDAARGSTSSTAGSPAGPASRPPVFAGLDGGLSTLPERLERGLTERGVRLERRTLVRELERTTTGWRLVAGPVPSPQVIEVDAVVLAVQATPAARLLRRESPLAAAELDGIDYASMAIVTLALPATARGDGPLRLPGSGFLVPPVDGHVIKAATFSASKWDWVRRRGDGAGVVVLRASIGRQGETADLQRDDPDLVALALRDLGAALRSALPEPLDAHVQRWGGALPQYAVGHLERVARIRGAVARLPGLELAGAAYEGVGIPACIATGRRAAEATLTHLGRRPAPGAQ